MRTERRTEQHAETNPTIWQRVASATLDGRRRAGWISTVLLLVLAVGLVPFGVSNGDDTGLVPTSANASPVQSLVQSDQAPPRSRASQMVASILPSVVNVRVVQVGTSPTGQIGEAKAEGSGVIVSSDGVIVTNNHVVEGAVRLRVVFTDGHRTMSGTVVGTDPEHDIAVVRVDASDLTPATMGRSSQLELADTVYAIGFPLNLGVTVTRGIVSGLERAVSVQRRAGAVEHLVGLLQTDAAINPGNSGGPLVDASGHVVGINTAGASAAAADNVGFAIGIDDAVPVVDQILAHPPAERAWLGVAAVSISSAAAAASFGLPPAVRGAAVVGVLPSSPAAAAGIHVHDVIASVDGRSIGSGAALTDALAAHIPGETVRIGLRRASGRWTTVDVRLGQRPAP